MKKNRQFTQSIFTESIFENKLSKKITVLTDGGKVYHFKTQDVIDMDKEIDEIEKTGEIVINVIF